MTNTCERRAESTRRIPVEALVEVCGVGGKLTPFEAESADLSGRGIRLRTAYLPETGSPVVCRFENNGQEVIAEGTVAWCHKETRGGEFGVRFTALDARSAEILRDLCGIDAPTPAESEPSEPLPVHRSKPNVTPGAKVKLHIEGLGSPMRARVDEGNGARISVGSTLEFLKIGRKLEMESLDDGSRREACIDGLDVSIDPRTGVPRLRVLLRTQSDEDTPQPSVVDAQRRKPNQAPPPRMSSEAKPTEFENERREPPSQEAIDEQVELMVGRMRRIAGSARRKMTEVSGQLGSQIGPSMGRAFQNMRQLTMRGGKEATPVRRKTAPAPQAAPTGSERKLRPQSGAPQNQEPGTIAPKFYQSTKFRRIAGAAAAVGLLTTVIVVAQRGPEPAKSAAIAPESLVAQPLAAAAPAAPAVGAPSTTDPSTSGGALVAQVPLFGPTPMATLEPAPLPAPAAPVAESDAAREMALAKATDAKLAAGVDPLAAGSEEPSSDAVEEPATKPEDVAPWGKGRMKDPTLYRIKLDSPGEAIKGVTSGKSFSVTIPGRKAMESPKGFASKDPRFSKISAQNSSSGVKVTWTFKDEVPPFRVRLRKSQIEVLISEAGKPKSE